MSVSHANTFSPTHSLAQTSSPYHMFCAVSVMKHTPVSPGGLICISLHVRHMCERLQKCTPLGVSLSPAVYAVCEHVCVCLLTGCQAFRTSGKLMEREQHYPTQAAVSSDSLMLKKARPPGGGSAVSMVSRGTAREQEMQRLDADLHQLKWLCILPPGFISHRSFSALRFWIIVSVARDRFVF